MEGDCGTCIRTARKSDSPGIRDLVFAVLREYGLAPDPEQTDRDLEDVEASYLDRGGIFLVLEANSALRGTAGLIPTGDGTCEIRKMYLHRDYRGRGIGRHLLERLLREARERGFSRVTLETASVLEEAVALYRRYGFREYTPEHISCRCDRALALDLTDDAEK
ncbi:MAG: GNAT family N-acetyltransferase [Spirochaetes bacterium]|nr:GNAT family N-acetyltransferase [Spirochaetota bacterium]